MKKVDQHLTRYPQKMPDHRRLCSGDRDRQRHEHADAPHALRLLRARRERPRRCRAAEQRDELATFHRITSRQVRRS
jgi:hypothetical protein